MYDGRAGPQHCEENEEGRLQHVPRQPLRSAQRIPTGHVVFVSLILGRCRTVVCREHRLNMEVDLQSLFGLIPVHPCLGFMSRDVHSCIHWLRPRNTPPHPPSISRIRTRIRGRYWSAKRDAISLCNPLAERKRCSVVSCC